MRGRADKKGRFDEVILHLHTSRLGIAVNSTVKQYNINLISN